MVSAIFQGPRAVSDFATLAANRHELLPAMYQLFFSTLYVI